MRQSLHLLAFLLTLSAMVPVRGALIRVGEDLGSFGAPGSSGYIAIPFSFENNDQGTQYVEFMANLFKPLFDDIYAFGQNSTNFATIGDMITGSSGSNQNFTYGLDSAPNYVNTGWIFSLNSIGEVYILEEDQDDGEPWRNSVDFSENHTVAGNFFVYTGLLSTTGNSGEYVFGDMTTGLQLAMSDNTYFEDFGVAAGVATTSGGSNIPTTYMGDDSRYVVAVIPEPGTLLLVGLAALALRFAQKIGDRR